MLIINMYCLSLKQTLHLLLWFRNTNLSHRVGISICGRQGRVYISIINAMALGGLAAWGAVHQQIWYRPNSSGTIYISYSYIACRIWKYSMESRWLNRVFINRNFCLLWNVKIWRTVILHSSSQSNCHSSLITEIHIPDSRLQVYS